MNIYPKFSQDQGRFIIFTTEFYEDQDRSGGDTSYFNTGIPLFGVPKISPNHSGRQCKVDVTS